MYTIRWKKKGQPYQGSFKTLLLVAWTIQIALSSQLLIFMTCFYAKSFARTNGIVELISKLSSLFKIKYIFVHISSLISATQHNLLLTIKKDG